MKRDYKHIPLDNHVVVAYIAKINMLLPGTTTFRDSIRLSCNMHTLPSSYVLHLL
jgi:hypothetical protein